MSSNWITDELPEKPCRCLCTIYGESTDEFYVVPCFWHCKPYHSRNWFEHEGKDISSEIIAWMKFPDPYEKSEEDG